MITLTNDQYTALISMMQNTLDVLKTTKEGSSDITLNREHFPDRTPWYINKKFALRVYDYKTNTKVYVQLGDDTYELVDINDATLYDNPEEANLALMKVITQRGFSNAGCCIECIDP